MKAKLTFALDLDDKQVAKILRSYNYPDDFEPIEVKEVLGNMDPKHLQELLRELHMIGHWQQNIQIEE